MLFMGYQKLAASVQVLHSILSKIKAHSLVEVTTSRRRERRYELSVYTKAYTRNFIHPRIFRKLNNM